MRAKRRIEVKTVLPQIFASSGRAMPASLVTSKSLVGTALLLSGSLDNAADRVGYPLKRGVLQ